MNKFNVGDKVRCVDNTRCPLVKNNIYTIDKYKDFKSDGKYLLYLTEYPNQSVYFYEYRFELAEVSKPAEPKNTGWGFE